LREHRPTSYHEPQVLPIPPASQPELSPGAPVKKYKVTGKRHIPCSDMYRVYSTPPRRTWTHIHDDIERRPWAFLPLLLIGSLIPALSTWYGGTNVGWELFGSEDRRFLTSQSGA